MISAVAGFSMPEVVQLAPHARHAQVTAHSLLCAKVQCVCLQYR